jgi:hypothetical protein
MKTTVASAMAAHAHVCEQCGITYHAQRSTSRFCSAACRLRHHRRAPREHRDLLRQWLLRRSYAGQVGAGKVALTVPPDVALADWNEWNPGAALGLADFRARLKRLSIRDYKASA